MCEQFNTIKGRAVRYMRKDIYFGNHGNEPYPRDHNNRKLKRCYKRTDFTLILYAYQFMIISIAQIVCKENEQKFVGCHSSISHNKNLALVPLVSIPQLFTD